ncbi:MAG: 6-O-methylguanine DNA methyltransferase [Candidatus Portnoybacteria bacterium CG10_big_fil_rev_8_21_14_0_10_44_7]|uniref:6-O-methylguanine DNA methyltransferase n=1 Tax=Candidatus Portnoybacteria bacterium CG10_big_fil_rev_8_21_14_0_10_44_7 TaxID=1974816 RepID=A0A2M8KJB2_9BACT|nr:MAG: 6-O-methylguanine DNA methyltransferase [Candidatus Portnoybacteria bacterium CG10_big_fil_rev_8_21_14_0_10_44_7]
MFETKMKSFLKKVIAVVRKIPKGQALSYQEVARQAGSPRAARAVGNILHNCGGVKEGIPCHRVVKSNGQIGGYAHGTKKKTTLLKKEGALK